MIFIFDSLFALLYASLKHLSEKSNNMEKHICEQIEADNRRK